MNVSIQVRDSNLTRGNTIMDIANANINLNIPQPETPFHKSTEGKLSQYCIFPEVNMLKIHLLKMLHFVMNYIYGIQDTR